MSIAVYGIAILVLIVSIMGGVAVHDHRIRADQQAKDKSALVACQANEKLALDANQELQDSIAPIAKERDAQTAKVQEWMDLANKAAGVAKMWRDLYTGTVVKLKVAQQQSLAMSRRPANPNATCQQVLGEIGDDSKAFARERAIMFPPVPPAGPPPKMRVQ